MSVPKERIWQELRRSCLDAIPSECRTRPANPVTLSVWLRSGYYRVQAGSKKQIELVVSSVDFGSALLADVESLLDSAAEHQASLRLHIASDQWLSPAWVGVTVYYWSYYLAMAITRLTGSTVWHLLPGAVQDLKRLGPSGITVPGGGCFRVICGSATSTTERGLILKKTDGRIHDELWRHWFRTCKNLMSKFAAGSSTSLEDRLFEALARSAKNLGDDWPSAFRTAINYRPGFAYTAVRKKAVLKPLTYLRTPNSYDMAELLTRFERGISSVRTASAIQDDPQAVMQVLVDLTFILHALVSELHSELVERYRLDRRWMGYRTHFVRGHGLHSEDGCWPT